MMKLIQAQGISKTYRQRNIEVKAIQDIDLAIHSGEFTAIVGPSGCGKTTLLNLIGGLDQPDKGTIRIAEQDITQLTENQLTDFRLHNIGFVFQNYSLLPVLSAWENVALVLQLQKIKPLKIKQISQEMLALVGLSDKLNARPTELSGGQQQRVAIARALATQPQFVLADEPTASLDSENADNLLELMQKINQEQGTTFVFSTHDSRIIARAKRIVRLRDGKIDGDSMI
ncbi:MAG: ABC transporter ATP-binding protein [Microscillaceae bacterium]|jgi:putative ABC transport system ATP-binding protein|nr:ABC transporter ATP-binding protein [Microscillaceae bacterium]